MVNETVNARRSAANHHRLPEDAFVPGLLICLAAIGWWWSARMGNQMAGRRGMNMSPVMVSMSFVTFTVAWVAMMGAMMFPAIVPVVMTYRRAALRRQVASTPMFVAGYIVVWSVVGAPVFFVWRALQGPISADATWAARLAGGVFIAAAVYQLSPLKSICLRRCQTPMSFFLKQGHDLRRPLGAARAGAVHGLVCFGCCWALMAVLVALGTMELAWMVIVAALIFLEKVLSQGLRVARAAAAGFLILGFVLLIHPVFLGRLT
jgi:predicted metal-binding membrane protein